MDGSVAKGFLTASGGIDVGVCFIRYFFQSGMTFRRFSLKQHRQSDNILVNNALPIVTASSGFGLYTSAAEHVIRGYDERTAE